MLDYSNLKSNLGSSALFASIIMDTDPKLLKGGRSGVAVNPLKDNDVRKISKSVVQLNRSYDKGVTNKVAKVTGELSKDWEVEPMKGRHWLEGYENLIAVSDKDDSVKYLRTYVGENPNIKTTVKYTVDGRDATDDELKIIKEYSPKKYESNKQAEQGLEGNEQVQPRDVTLTNVVKLKVGNFSFSR